MKRIPKLIIASLLAITLGVASVICCCIAPTVMAHFSKKDMACSHCPGEKSHGNSSNPLGACQQQLTSADVIHHSTLSSSVLSTKYLSLSLSFINYQNNLTHSILLAYPPGGPPLGISFTPLYLRTFNLRV